jgi:two-component system, cell cycle response regulator
MMTKISDNIFSGDINPEIDAADVRFTDPAGSESIHTQLEEARFISAFMAAVCTSLELDEICSIAARALYRHAPFYRIVFAFPEALEGKTVSFSPMVQKGVLTVSPKTAAGTSCADSDLHANSLASAHLTLLDNLGTVAIYYKSGQEEMFSTSLLVSITAPFSQAIKNALEHGKMRDLAMRDGLTGLFNRRIFDETLAQKIKTPDMRPVSLLLIDLDNFKQVNDTFGHQAGDLVLKTFAMILKESCRGHDLVARFGGEEFAIILSQTQPAAAYAIAQRIRNRLAKTVFTFDDQLLQVTASIGLATCREGNSIFTASLVKQADRALYEAKKTGKNMVCVFPTDLLTEAESSPDRGNYGTFAQAHC